MPLQLPLDLPYVPSLARDDLIISDANRTAVDAIDAWPHWRHSVLLVAGPEGSGKSHLAHAWAEQSNAVFVEAGSASTLLGETPFRGVIDDVDRGQVPEEEIFALVNAARLGGGTLLITSRVHPAELRGLTPDLQSRLTAATLAELRQPDDALLQAVFFKIFADRQLDVTPDVVSLLTRRIERSLAAVQDWASAIDRRALSENRPVTRRMVSRLLDEAAADCHDSIVTVAYPSAGKENVDE